MEVLWKKTAGKRKENSWFSRKIETPRKRASKEPKETQHKYQNTKEANREATIKTSNNFRKTFSQDAARPAGPLPHTGLRRPLPDGSWRERPILDLEPQTVHRAVLQAGHCPPNGRWAVKSHTTFSEEVRPPDQLHWQKVRGGAVGGEATPQHTPIGCRVGNGSRLPGPLPFTHGHGTATLFAVLLHQQKETKEKREDGENRSRRRRRAESWRNCQGTSRQTGCPNNGGFGLRLCRSFGPLVRGAAGARHRRGARSTPPPAAPPSPTFWSKFRNGSAPEDLANQILINHTRFKV